MIMAADKGKGIVVVTPELYREMGREHISKDKPVEWSDLRQCQKEVTGHAKALSRIFRVGEERGERNGARCFDNLTS